MRIGPACSQYGAATNESGPSLAMASWLSVMMLAIALPLDAAGQPIPWAVVRGSVTDGAGVPLKFVNVQIAGSTDGAATAADGWFEFRTRHRGEQQIRATMIGFEDHLESVFLSSGDTVTVGILLRKALVRLDETIVEADAYTTGDAETATLNTLEVVTTAGAAADIFQAIKTFPGLAMVDEGAGLFVRGGDVSETVVLLDQATVTHPYKFESPTGGVFGTISPFLVRGTVFSAGGFSAKYGNALSAILAMDSQDLPPAQQYTLGLGIAAASVAAHVPLVSRRLGLRFTGNRSFTGTMFRLNGQKDQFVTTPRSLDGNLSVIYQYSPTGRVKLFNFVTDESVGVFVPEPSFDGIYRGETTSWLHNIQWTDVLGLWFVQASASLGRYAARQQLGGLDLQPGDDTYKLRIDAEHEYNRRLSLRVGAEAERTTGHVVGRVPANESVLDPRAQTLFFDDTDSATRVGLYGEGELGLARRLVLVAGTRADYHSLSDRTTIDPRLSLRYLVSGASRIRLAWGLYRQFAQPYQFRAATSQSALKPQLARHFILGWHTEQGPWMLRLEAYHKQYRNLTLAAKESTYSSSGEGSSQGLDVFLKYSAYLETRLNGWIAYSLLDSKRLQNRHVGRARVIEQGPSPYDITHNLTVVGKVRVAWYLYGSVTFRHATGRPITPVLDALAGEGGNYYLPVEGPPGSERLPDFRRLDVSASYFLPLGAHNATVYLSVGNTLNRPNVLDYDYSLDYSTRSERSTQYRRFLYFGAVINLSP